MRRNIKRALSVILVIAMCVAIYPSVATAQTYSGSCGESAVWEFDDTTGTLIISGTGETYGYNANYDVSYLPWNSYRTKITSVIVEEGITKINKYFFYKLTSVITITFPASLESVVQTAFGECTLLEEYIVDDANQSYCAINGILYNKDVTHLVKYPLGKTDTEYAFPDTVVTMETSAFEGNSRIVSLNIPGSMENIPGFSFQLFKALETLVINDGVKTIGEHAFRYCEKLSSVTLSNTLVSIGENAFFSDSKITNISLPETLESIGASAFSSCRIKSIFIPKNVYQIGDNNLSMDYLNNISVDPENKVYSSIDGCLYNKEQTIIYDAQNYLKTFTFPDTVSEIAANAFLMCTSLTNITIPEKVTTIGRGAFYHCWNLQSVNIPSKIENIYNYTFSYCSSLKNIEIPKSVKTINSTAFSSTTLNSALYLGSEDYWNQNVTVEGNENLINVLTFALCIDGHTASSIVLENVLEGNCQSEGSYDEVVYCQVCDYEMSRNNVVTGYGDHIYETNINPPTCTTDGTATYTCTLCEYTYDEVQSATGHSPVVDDAVEPTCTENGLTEGSHCSICNEVLVPQATVDALGHTYVKSVYPSTCTKEGYTEYICEACGDMYTADYTDILEHSFDNNAEYCLNGCMEKNPSYISPVTENTDVTILDNEQETTAPVDEITEIDKTTQIITQDAPQETVYQDITELLQDLTEIEKTQIEEAVTEEEQEEPEKYSGKIKTEYEAFRIVSGIKSVKIAWTNDEDLLGYEVYVSNSIDGDFKKIDDVKTEESHYTVINGLNSNSVYYFRLVGYLDYNGEIIKMEESRVKGVFVK